MTVDIITGAETHLETDFRRPGAAVPIVLGAFTVLVAGLPLPNTPDPAKWLMNEIKGLLEKKKAGGENGAEAGGGGSC